MTNPVRKEDRHDCLGSIHLPCNGRKDVQQGIVVELANNLIKYLKEATCDDIQFQTGIFRVLSFSYPTSSHSHLRLPFLICAKKYPVR